MLHGQTGRFNDRFDVVERLAHLRRKSRRQTAVRATRSLPGDVDVVSGIHAGGVETIGCAERLRREQRPAPGACATSVDDEQTIQPIAIAWNLRGFFEIQFQLA